VARQTPTSRLTATPEEVRAIRPEQRLALVVAGLSLAFTVGLALRTGFVSDDYIQLFELRRPLGETLHKYFTDPGRCGYHRPLAWLAHWLLGCIDGANPVVFHAANLLGAFAATAGVYRLTQVISRRIDVAVWATMIFAVRFTHPETVIWVSGFGDVFMTAAFVWACVYAAKCLDGFRWRLVVYSTVLYGTALLFKEAALSLLPVLICAFLFHPSSRRNLRPLLLLIMLVTGCWMIWRWSIGAALPASVTAWDFHPAAVGRNLAFYSAQMLFPWRTGFSILGYEKYEALKAVFPLRLTDPYQLLVIAILFIVVTIAVWGLRRRLTTTVVSGFALCVVTLAPFAAFAGTGLRFLFLPSVGFSVLLGGLLPRSGPHYRKVSKILVVITILSVLCLAERAYRWERGGEEARRLLRATSQLLASAQTDDPLWISNVPRRINGAFVFPIGYMAAARFYFGRAGVRILDGDLLAVRGDSPPPKAHFFRWNGRKLIPDSDKKEKTGY